MTNPRTEAKRTESTEEGTGYGTLDDLRAFLSRNGVEGFLLTLDHQQARTERLEKALDTALDYVHCCGYRREDEAGFPHVTGCRLAEALQEQDQP